MRDQERLGEMLVKTTSLKGEIGEIRTGIVPNSDREVGPTVNGIPELRRLSSVDEKLSNPLPASGVVSSG